MESWDLRSIETAAHEPQIISSAEDARAVVLQLPAGEQLREHEVHERARVVVIDGEVEVSTPGGGGVSGASGHLFEFAPGERHTIVASSDARLLLLLSPWPGDGHPGAMTLEQKENVRERAAERADR